MPFKKDVSSLLNDILGDIQRIRNFTHNMSYADFENDEAVSYSVNYALLRISEAVTRLGSDTDQISTKISWREIRGIGNWLRHAYDSIDPELIWTIIERDLDLLESAIRKGSK